jgi:cellulose synthase/poly-beta-1,6-N-acetylglucosamine synthase-like glycosyltransferase
MEEAVFNVVRYIVGFFVITTLVKNFFFLVISPFYPVREKLRYIRAMKNRDAKGAVYAPRVSVVVPAWNEEVGVLKTINSVLENGYANAELIIVNDGSTDNSDTVIKDYLKEIRKTKRNAIARIVYVYQANGGKGVALNTGIKLTKGEIILTMDADSAIEKGALAKLVRYYMDPEVMAVVGNVEVANKSTLVGYAQHLEYYFGFYNKRAHALMGAEYIFGGACASFRRHVFKTIGLFDTKNKTEDIEMSMRTRFHGYKCTYAEDVVCYTEGASDIRGLIAQRVRWKKGRLDTFRKYRALFFSTEDHHNVFLSFFVLPFSMLAELQLLFEPVAIAIFIAYCIVTSEFLSLSIGLLFIFLVFVAVSFFHNTRPRPWLVFSFPFVWPIFYMLDWIEFLSLYKSLKMIRSGKDVEWQRWNRQGVGSTLQLGDEKA